MKEETVLVKFIKDNGLAFTGTGSGLNSDCIILSGFCNYKKIPLDDALDEFKGNGNYGDIEKELTKTHKYAEENNYGIWWASTAARDMYTFDVD